jgi:subtilisin-like proprotein convertase family protein
MLNRTPKILLAALAATIAVLALSSSAMADIRTFSNTDNIRPADPASGGIDPVHYPSEIDVAGVPGTISHVQVELHGVGTQFTGDLDVLLVSPGGQAVMLMSDVSGRNPIAFATLSFSDTSQPMPSGDPIATGFYRPTNLQGDDDAMPRPAPAGPYTDTKLAAFDGGEPNGKWSLLVVDDAAGDENHISLGWNLTLTTAGGKIFRNNTPIVAPDRESTQAPPATANPYPSPIDVSGLKEKIDRVTVTLHDIDIDAAVDMDLLLVGPDGTSVVLTSDVGSGNHVSGADLGFDDAAATPIELGKTLTPGVHKPSDSDNANTEEPSGEDTFPTPAPQQAHGAALKAFRNTDPNGQWRLFLTDDSHSEVNNVNGGWSLNFTLLDDAPIEEPAPVPAPAPVPDPAPAPAPAPVPGPVKPAPLVLSGLRLKPSVFRVNKGTTVSYKLSAAAKVRFAVVRKGKVRASLKQTGKPGANKLRFKPRKLVPGKYKLVATAGSAVKTVGFRVTARR